MNTCPGCEDETSYCREHQKREIALEQKGWYCVDINNYMDKVEA